MSNHKVRHCRFFYGQPLSRNQSQTLLSDLTVKHFLTACLTLCLLPWAFSQSTISGIILDEKNQGLPYAVVQVFSPTDSLPIKGTVANAAGAFVLLQLTTGTYKLQISALGYQDFTTKNLATQPNQTLDVGAIALKLSLKNLKEVVITAKKPYLENQIDRLVLNVGSQTTLTALNSFEILQRAPSIFIDPNDNISMSGKQGVNVLINGKPTYLAGRNLTTYLKSLPANSIEKVEIIANPSAEFDAQGNAGIVNIVLKRNQNLGINGGITADYTQSTHARQTLSGDFNWRQARFNVFGYASLKAGRQNTNVENSRLLSAERGIVQTQTGFDAENWKGQDLRLGADYFLGSKHTLGVAALVNNYRNPLQNHNLILTNGTPTNNRIRTLNDAPIVQNRTNLNLNYRFSDTTGTTFNLDLDYILYQGSLINNLLNDFLNANNEVMSVKLLKNSTEGQIGAFSIKGDVTKEWNAKKLKLDAGFKVAFSETNNDFRAYLVNSTTELDPKRSNFYVYDENISAVYAKVNKRFNKITAQLGIRAEHTRAKGISNDLAGNRTLNPDAAYVNLFPTAYVNYQPSDNHALNFGFGRRINRPSYQDLNPFLNQLNLFTAERGNPNLRPSFSNYVETSYTYRGAASIKLSYTETDNLLTQITEREGDVFYLTPQNAGKQQNFSLNIGSPLPISKVWSGYIFLGPFYNRYQARLLDGNLAVSTWGFSGYWGNDFKISQKTTLELSGWYNAPTQATIFRNRGIGAINAGIQHKFFDGKLIAKLSINDLFNQMNYRSSVDFQSLNYSIYRKWESQRVGFSLTYRFGNNKVKERRERDLGAEAEKERVKMKSSN